MAIMDDEESLCENAERIRQEKQQKNVYIEKYGTILGTQLYDYQTTSSEKQRAKLKQRLYEQIATTLTYGDMLQKVAIISLIFEMVDVHIGESIERIDPNSNSPIY